MASGGEIITIINNSGKIIGTGKQLVGIFKEARAAYRDRKDAVKADKAERVAGIKRAQTFNVSQPSHHLGVLEEDEEDEIDRLYEQRAIRDVPHRRHSQDDGRSEASNRSHRSRRPQPAPSTDRDRQMITLTESNLRTHTEVSATTPSAAPAGYRAPYAETAPRDMQLSRPTLTHAATMPLPTPTEVTTPVSTPRQSMVVHRSRSDIQPKKKEIDMDLAYGNVPPDLASRVDLDHDQTRDRAVALSKNSPAPAPMASASTDTSDDPESQAINMIDRIEGLLDEAHCLHHTASSMIAHLQENPQAAAAVALTLAELSALVGKMSPAFLGVIKGGSPAIFALLASPQFLIGTGIAVGVTVLIFGGLKIVKRMTAAREREAPIEMQGMGGAAAPKSEVSYEEALVLEVEEELSTIESWRRGVEPSCIGDDYDEEEEAADVELMSPEADRALREKFQEEVDPWDSVSQAGRSTARSYRSQRSHRSRRPKGEGEDVEVPERKSSKRYYGEGGASEVAESVRSSRSHRSHSSRLSKREEVEEAGKPKEKKNNMLRLLFRKLKEKEQKEKDAGKDKEKSKEKDRESKVGRDKESTVGKDKESRVVKDRESTVGRDKESRVGKDRESRVGKDRESRVGKDRESRVGRDKDSSVGRDRESRVGKDRESRVGASRAMSIMA